MQDFSEYVFPPNSFIDLFICHFGQHQCAPMHSYGPAIRNHFLFHYIYSGKGMLHSMNEKNQNISYPLEAGQGFLIWPRQQNTYVADKEQPWSYYWIEFDGLKARDILAQAGLNYNQPIYTPLPNNPPPGKFSQEQVGGCAALYCK